MTVRTATPYLTLSGNAEEAIRFYQRQLGATVESLLRFGEMMPQCSEAQREPVMHAELRIGHAVIFLSDGGPEVTSGSSRLSIALQGDDPDEARHGFAALAESGSVIEPIGEAPWDDLYGAVEDRFGVSWMFNCTIPK